MATFILFQFVSSAMGPAGHNNRVCLFNVSYDAKVQSTQTFAHSLLALSKALKCLACRWLGTPFSTWQVEMGWPDIHWLARDQGGLVAATSDYVSQSWVLDLKPHEPHLKISVFAFLSLMLARGFPPPCKVRTVLAKAVLSLPLIIRPRRGCHKASHPTTLLQEGTQILLVRIRP
jgi:hypothetical protein